MTIGLYGDRKWGNCQRVAWTFEYPGISYRWADVDILKGETRSAECLGIHSAVQLPVIILSDGRPLAQSNAIMTCLAEGTDLSGYTARSTTANPTSRLSGRTELIER
jgi:glutathione S-transferase